MELRLDGCYQGVPGLYRSASVSDLVSALAAAQVKFGLITKERTAEVISRRTGGRYTYAYADLADALDAVRHALSEHGIALLQFPIEAGDQVGALTLVAKGDEWMACAMLVPFEAQSGAQGKGSAVTYARRYGLMALLAVAAKGEDDDAAAVTPEVAAATPRATMPPPPPPPPPARTSVEPAVDTGQPLYVMGVRQKPTSKVGITRYEVTFSDGRMASTIHQDLAAAAQAFQVERAPVRVEVEETRWGLNLKAIVASDQEEPDGEDRGNQDSNDDVVPF